MLRPGRPVELARRDQHPDGRQRRDGVPAGLAAGAPQVQAGLRVRHLEARAAHGGQQQGATGGVPLPLLVDVRTVAQCRDHRGLHGAGHQQSDVLAGLDQGGDRVGVARREPGPVAREVAALGQRVDGQHALRRAAADRRVQDGDRLDVPAQLEVALVAGDQHAVLTAPGDDRREPLRRQDLTGRVGRRVHPDQGHVRRVAGGRVVGGDGHAPRQAGAHVVRRVGQRRDQHLAARCQPEQRRQQRHRLLGPDRGHHLRRRHRCAEPGHPGHQRFSQRGGADGQRVAGVVRRRRQGVRHQAWRRVDGCADRQVDDAARVGAGLLAVRREPVPREGGQTRARRPPGTGGRRGRRHGRAQWPSVFLPSGTAMMTGWSRSTGPTLEAPPGEPMVVVSVKKSTFAR